MLHAAAETKTHSHGTKGSTHRIYLGETAKKGEKKEKKTNETYQSHDDGERSFHEATRGCAWHCTPNTN